MDDEAARGLQAVEFLARSPTRVRLLSVLVREGQVSKDELHERVDASRTTIQRNLKGLEAQGWVTGTNSDYNATVAGEWVVEDFTALVETIEEAETLGSVLELTETSWFGFDPRQVDFEVTTAEPGNPLKMVHEHARAVGRSNEVRALLPQIGTEPVRASHERVVEHEVSTTMVVSETVLEVFRSDADIRSLVEAQLEVDAFELFVTDAEIPFYLGLLDDEVELGISKDGQPHALLRTDARRVFEWAATTFAEFRGDAIEVRDL
jgi:predicted transcriptional regulator